MLDNEEVKPTSDEVFQQIRDFTAALARTGETLTKEGIFRLSANTELKNALATRGLLEQDKTVTTTVTKGRFRRKSTDVEEVVEGTLDSNGQVKDVILVSAALKEIGRRLSFGESTVFDGDITRAYQEMKPVLKSGDEQSITSAVSVYVSALKEKAAAGSLQAQCVLELCELMQKIADHADVNKMKLSNLAVVMGPTFYRFLGVEELSLVEQATKTAELNKLFEMVCTHGKDFSYGQESTQHELDESQINQEITDLVGQHHAQYSAQDMLDYINTLAEHYGITDAHPSMKTIEHYQKFYLEAQRSQSAPQLGQQGGPNRAPPKRPPPKTADSNGSPSRRPPKRPPPTSTTVKPSRSQSASPTVGGRTSKRSEFIRSQAAEFSAILEQVESLSKAVSTENITAAVEGQLLGMSEQIQTLQSDFQRLLGVIQSKGGGVEQAVWKKANFDPALIAQIEKLLSACLETIDQQLGEMNALSSQLIEQIQQDRPVTDGLLAGETQRVVEEWLEKVDHEPTDAEREQLQRVVAIMKEECDRRLSAPSASMYPQLIPTLQRAQQALDELGSQLPDMVAKAGKPVQADTPATKPVPATRIQSPETKGRPKPPPRRPAPTRQGGTGITPIPAVGRNVSSDKSSSVPEPRTLAKKPPVKPRSQGASTGMPLPPPPPSAQELHGPVTEVTKNERMVSAPTGNLLALEARKKAEQSSGSAKPEPPKRPAPKPRSGPSGSSTG